MCTSVVTKQPKLAVILVRMITSRCYRYHLTSNYSFQIGQFTIENCTKIGNAAEQLFDAVLACLFISHVFFVFL